MALGEDAPSSCLHVRVRAKRYQTLWLSLSCRALHPLLCKFLQRLHIHQEWPICHLTGERHSFSAKPVQANLMSYLGTKRLLPSSAELQLQPLKSTAQTPNCPCFTTASIIRSVQAPATFSAAVRNCLLAALSHPCHGSPALQPLNKDKSHYHQSLTSTFVPPLF